MYSQFPKIVELSEILPNLFRKIAVTLILNSQRFQN